MINYNSIINNIQFFDILVIFEKTFYITALVINSAEIILVKMWKLVSL